VLVARHARQYGAANLSPLGSQLTVGEPQHAVSLPREFSVTASVLFEIVPLVMKLPAVQLDDQLFADQQINTTYPANPDLRASCNPEVLESKAHDRLNDGLGCRINSLKQPPESSWQGRNIVDPLLPSEMSEPNCGICGSDYPLGGLAERHIPKGLPHGRYEAIVEMRWVGPMGDDRGIRIVAQAL
jgi:hypothetical protein